MKTLHRFIFAVMSVSIALSSCTKENISGRDGSDSAILAGERLLKVSFEPGTKTELNTTGGVLSPEFVAGDKIRVSNGTAYEDCTVRIDEKGVFFIRTALTGVLDAVYPVTAAAMSGNAITGIQVPSSQSGLFKDANICMAEDVAADATAMHFSNRTTILQFYVDASIDVKSITITSGGGDIATGSTPKNVTVSATGGASLHTIAEDDKHRLCYASILPGVSANALTFKSVTNTQGTVERTMQSTAALAVNRIYKAFIPYYIDLDEVGKWAYCNMGAFLPEEEGDFFMWGEIKGHARGNFTFTNPDSARYPNPAFSSTAGLVQANAPYWNGSKYIKYTGSDNPILEPLDDAATVTWGANWCIPTIEDLTVLYSSVTWTKGTKMTYATKGTAKLSFPCTGYAQEKGVYSDVSGYYISSTLKPADITGFQILTFSTGSEFKRQLTGAPRWHAHSIRPIYKYPKEGLNVGPYIDNDDIIK